MHGLFSFLSPYCPTRLELSYYEGGNRRVTSLVIMSMMIIIDYDYYDFFKLPFFVLSGLTSISRVWYRRL